MKVLLLSALTILQLLFVNCNVLPDYLPKPCSKSSENYNECFSNFLRKLGPHILKGIREINLQSFQPLNIPVFVVNRTVGSVVSLSTTIKNSESWGFNSSELKKFTYDHNTNSGEVQYMVKYLEAKAFYEAKGRLLSIDLGSAGVVEGNATDLDVVIKFVLKPRDVLGIQYYEFENFSAKVNVGSVHMKMTAADSKFQHISDAIANFVNEDPRRALDAINPIYEESVQVLYREVISRVLQKIPVSELIPQ